MSLKALYERFLARPDPDLLSVDVSLNYITTASTFNGRDDVAKHLVRQNSIVSKKAVKILGAVEGPRSLCLDVEFTVEFVGGGGAYLLTLDENFIIDRVVTFPLIHIVHFDNDQKISQIRLYWDQGSLLKQLDVIGAHSRNWPICDGAEQLRLIKASAEKHVESSSEENRERKNHAHGAPERPSKKHPKENEATFSLFESLSLGEDRPISTTARGSAKPAPRDYTEIFGGDDPDVTPTKPEKGPLKGTAGHRHNQSRIFEEEDNDNKRTVPQTPLTNSKKYSHFEFGESEAPTPTSKTNSKKYNHFEFGEAEVPISAAKPSQAKSFSHFEFGEEAPAPAAPQQNKVDNHFELGEDPQRAPQQVPARARTKHMSQWDFEDFYTPAEVKPQPKIRNQEVRHFGWSDDETDLVNTPPKPTRVVHPRRDTETHFKIQDEGTPFPAEKEPSRRTGGGRGLQLYESNLFDESADAGTESSEKPQKNVSNGINRKKDFNNHWTMTDELSPEPDAAEKDDPKTLPSDRMKAVKMMNSNWDIYDDENAAAQQPPATSTAAKRVSRNVNQRSWGFGDEDM
ncbi:hypothetical protein VTO42DRAFT_800 [Malbranchea cinnamomea]